MRTCRLSGLRQRGKLGPSPQAAGLLRSEGTDAMNVFLPVAPGRQGRRGFGTAPTKHLATLLRRYQRIRDDPATDPDTRAYARKIVTELRDEFARRGQNRAAAA